MSKEATAAKPKKTTKKAASKKYLVIVESPAKASTIGKFLGSNYKIEASMGHIRDLPKSQMGIDIEHDFEPKYITIRGKGDLLSKLKKRRRLPIKSIWQLTRTVKGKPSVGICFTPSI